MLVCSGANQAECNKAYIFNFNDTIFATQMLYCKMVHFLFAKYDIVLVLYALFVYHEQSYSL